MFLRGVSVVLVTAAALAAVPGEAAAGDLNIEAAGAFYTAAPGEENALTITRSGAEDVFEDAAGIENAPAPLVCTRDSTDPDHKVRCPARPSYAVWLGDGNDSATLPPSPNPPGFALVVGGDGNDSIMGGLQENELVGDGPNAPGGDYSAYEPLGDGDDTIAGSDGQDVIYAGAGADKIGGGGGSDIVRYNNRTGADAKRVVVDPDNDYPTTPGDDGEDSDGDGQADEGDSVSADVERVAGGDGDDLLRAGTATTYLAGSGGGDLLDASLAQGQQTILDGGFGVDTVSYAARSGTTPLLISLGGVDDDGADTDGNGTSDEQDSVQDVENATGGDGDDQVTGDGQDNRLDGRGGADVLEGLGGVDRALYSTRASGQPVTVDLDGNPDDGTAGVDGPSGGPLDNIKADIEGVEGGAGSDRLTGNGGANELDGRGGSDSIEGAAGGDALLGREGTDLLDGGIGPDSISGGAGAADRATYASRVSSQPVTADLDGAADDGGSADARADRVATNVEQLLGGSGADTLTGSPAANRLDGGPGSDRLLGAAGADSLIGQAGNDLFDGGIGPDDMSGGSGGGDRASYATRSAPVTVDLDSAADDGGSADGRRDKVRSDIEQVTGGSRADTLTDSNVANVLEGGRGADTLRALGGNDTIQARDRVSDARVDCGRGKDLARLDRLPRDPLARVVGCESTPRG